MDGIFPDARDLIGRFHFGDEDLGVIRNFSDFVSNSQFENKRQSHQQENNLLPGQTPWHETWCSKARRPRRASLTKVLRMFQLIGGRFTFDEEVAEMEKEENMQVKSMP
jgi:hypothetical protein